MNFVKKFNFSRSGSSGLVVKRKPTWATWPMTDTKSSMPMSGASNVPMSKNWSLLRRMKLSGVISTTARMSKK